MGGSTPEPGDAPSAAELAELRGRVAALERPRHRLVSLLAAVLIVLGCVLTPLGLLSAWTKAELSDTDRYVATMAPLAHDPAVRAAVTDRVTSAIMQYVPADSLLNGLAPSDIPALNALLGQLGGALTDGINGFVHDQVQAFVNSDAFATAWTELNRSAHAAVLKALTGQGGGAVQLKGDTVTLDLAPVIDQMKNRLVASGLSIASQIPEVHTDYVLLTSDAVQNARTWFQLLQLAGFWLPALAVVCVAAGVLLAARRRRALVAGVLGMAAGAALLGVAITVVRALYLDKLPAGVDQAAAKTVYDALTRSLRGTVRAVIVLGVLVALCAWLSGTGRRAGTLRTLWRAGIDAVRQTAKRMGLRLGAVGRFAHRFKAELGWAAVAAVVAVFLLWSRPTGLVMFWLAVALVLALALVEFLDDPGDTPADAGRSGQPPPGGTTPLP